jgi:hypothetical protein
MHNIMASFTFYIPRVGPECSGPFAAGLLASHGFGRVVRLDIVPVGADDIRDSVEWAVLGPDQSYPLSYAFVHCEDVPAAVVARARSPRATVHLPLPVAPDCAKAPYWLLAESTADTEIPNHRVATHELSPDGSTWHIVLRSSDNPGDDVRGRPMPAAAFAWPLLASSLRRDAGSRCGGLVLRDLGGFESSRGSALAGLTAWLAADLPQRPYRLTGKGHLRVSPLSLEPDITGLHRIVESIGVVTTCCPAAEWGVTAHTGSISLDIDVFSPDVPRLQIAAQMLRDLCSAASLDGDLTLTLQPPCGLPTTYRCTKSRHVALAEEP